jgi:hypothetical protein
MLFVDRIFTYFSKYEKTSDINKDVNGKGTLERYNETVGDDIDSNLMPLIDNLIKNVLEPAKCLDNFVPYGEADMGVRVVLRDTLQYRRAVLSIINRLHQIKGTLKGYYVLFGKLGWQVTITEYFDAGGFDSPTTFDDNLRTFDSKECLPCSDYSMDIVTIGGGPPTSDDMATINSVIGFNEPINAHLRQLTFNGTTTTPIPDYNDDFNNDFSI